MRLRRLTLLLLTTAACVTTYAATVRRGGMAFRIETPWETAASGSGPFDTTIYAEQRLPLYPSPRLAPLFEVIHTLDLHLRWQYWHEPDIPDFDAAPDFTLTTTPASPTPRNAASLPTTTRSNPPSDF